MSDAPSTPSRHVPAEPLSFPCGASHRPALVHRAERPSGHLVVNLHGAPGAPLGPVSPLADALAPRGVDLLRFNYSGLWGNPGVFDLETAIEDVGCVLDFLTSDAAHAQAGVAPTHVHLVGFAFGAAVGLVRAREDDRVAGVAALSPCDHAVFARVLQDPQAPSRPILDSMLDQLFGDKGAVEQDPDIFREDLIEGAERYALPAHAGDLLGARLLLLAGQDDLVCRIEEHVLPLYRELRRLGHPDLQLDVVAADHGLGAAREGLYGRIADWVAAAKTGDP